MPAPTTDLWPEFQAPEAINSPVFLLKEQAAALRNKTKGLVLADLHRLPRRTVAFGSDSTSILRPSVSTRIICSR